MVTVVNVCFTGGGTGGHLYPALNVADTLKQRHPHWLLWYIGGEKGLEKGVMASRDDFTTMFLPMEGMPRSKQWKDLWPWLKRLIFSTWQAGKFLWHHKIHVIFATGGYVTAPVLLAGTLLGIPFILLEPDAQIGLVNKLMAPFAHTVCVAFERTRDVLAQKTKAMVQLTGNPLKSQTGMIKREDALAWAKQFPGRGAWYETPEKPTLLVMGGSQGARAINTVMVLCLERFLQKGMRVIHVTGQKLYQETVSRYPDALRYHTDYWVMPYSQDLPYLMAMADVAVSRAGSMSLSELAMAGLPAVLIPFPESAGQHQQHNAESLAKVGAALCVLESEMTPELFEEKVSSILLDPDVQDSMHRCMQAQAKPDATSRIIHLLETVASV
ncbi:MAG: UDP-N-acetylglucosamine--N-acetylmuramyl-(pentapeptide) pyrophosphoryl-undecaprenol N-acetylglucosamine transferase [Vampirovibrionales bacterium]